MLCFLVISSLNEEYGIDGMKEILSLINRTDHLLMDMEQLFPERPGNKGRLILLSNNRTKLEKQI